MTPKLDSSASLETLAVISVSPPPAAAPTSRRHRRPDHPATSNATTARVLPPIEHLRTEPEQDDASRSGFSAVRPWSSATASTSAGFRFSLRDSEPPGPQFALRRRHGCPSFRPRDPLLGFKLCCIALAGFAPFLFEGLFPHFFRFQVPRPRRQPDFEEGWRGPERRFLGSGGAEAMASFLVDGGRGRRTPRPVPVQIGRFGPRGSRGRVRFRCSCMRVEELDLALADVSRSEGRGSLRDSSNCSSRRRTWTVTAATRTPARRLPAHPPPKSSCASSAPVIVVQRLVQLPGGNIDKQVAEHDRRPGPRSGAAPTAGPTPRSARHARLLLGLDGYLIAGARVLSESVPFTTRYGVRADRFRDGREGTRMEALR